LRAFFDERFCVRGAVGAIAHAVNAGGGLKRLALEPGHFGTRPVVFLTEEAARGRRQ